MTESKETIVPLKLDAKECVVSRKLDNGFTSLFYSAHFFPGKGCKFSSTLSEENTATFTLINVSLEVDDWCKFVGAFLKFLGENAMFFYDSLRPCVFLGSNMRHSGDDVGKLQLSVLDKGFSGQPTMTLSNGILVVTHDSGYDRIRNQWFLNVFSTEITEDILRKWPKLVRGTNYKVTTLSSDQPAKHLHTISNVDMSDQDWTDLIFLVLRRVSGLIQNHRLIEHLSRFLAFSV